MSYSQLAETKKPLGQSKDILFSDFSFSFIPNPKTGDITVLSNEKAVKNSIQNLLLTKSGEIVFDSRIGSGLYARLFEPMDNITKRSMETEIINTLNAYEPRVSINQINIIEDLEKQGYYINIYFTIINTYTIQTVEIFLQRNR